MQSFFFSSSMTSMMVWYLLPLILWGIAWRGVALWKSAQHKQLPWFIALFLINSIGILPIVYIVFFQPKKGKK